MLEWSPLRKARSATSQFGEVSFSPFIRSVVGQLEERQARLRDLQRAAGSVLSPGTPGRSTGLRCSCSRSHVACFLSEL